MAQEEGLVSTIKEDGWAEVVTERKDACENCGAQHCCVAFGSGSEMVVKALNRAGAKVGDQVSLSLSSGTLLKGAAILYLIPLAGLLLGAAIGAGLNQRLALSETAAVVIFGFAGLFLGLVITRLISRWMSAHNRLTPIITRVLRPSIEEPGRR
ncbi:MAG: SoxR reducing system RseC family protein [Deltaproteobacteria bacterium]|nr:MAG: SoxR reducing system RseC family protein [Deltaproteobacteria bacterium]